MQKTDHQKISFLNKQELTQREEMIVLHLSAATNATAPIVASLYHEFQEIYKKYLYKKK